MKVTGLAVCRRGGLASAPVDPLVLTPLGIEGDRHAGPTLIAGPRQKGVARGTVLPNDRQVSLVSATESARIALMLGLPRLDFTWLAANVELDEGSLTHLTPGTSLVFEGGVVLRVSGENEPCRKAGRIIAQATGVPVEFKFARAAMGLRGVVASVLTPGHVRLGERAEVRPP